MMAKTCEGLGVAKTDLIFPADGSIGPRPGEHWYPGYKMFSAFSLALRWAHELDGVGILWEPGALTVRCPDELVPSLSRLGGRRLDVGGRPLVLGAPVQQQIVSSASLAADFVTASSSATKRCMVVDELLAHLRKDVEGAEIHIDREAVKMMVSTRIVLGYRIELHGLTDEQSISVQEHGLGGRRRMGAGVFFPCPQRRSR